MDEHSRQKNRGIEDEEYASELTPRRIQVRQPERAFTNRVDPSLIIGYIGLFFALFSIVFYPIIFGSIGVVMGLLAVSYGAKTLGYTAAGFGAFSVLFSILYPLIFYNF